MASRLHVSERLGKENGHGKEKQEVGEVEGPESGEDFDRDQRLRSGCAVVSLCLGQREK